MAGQEDMPPIPPGGLRLSEGPVEPGVPDDAGVAALKAFFAALDASDPVAVRAVLADDVVQQVSGRGPFAGHHEGPEAVLALAAAMRNALDEGPTMRPLVWLAAGPASHVVAHVEMAAGARRLATEQAMVFRTRDGRITAIRDYQDDQYAFDEFWLAVIAEAERSMSS